MIGLVVAEKRVAESQVFDHQEALVGLRLTVPCICKGVDCAIRAKLMRVVNLVTHLASPATVNVLLPAHHSA